jgi:hypothetical protein
MGGGGKSKPKAAKPVAAVSYRKETPREDMGGSSRRPLGAQYMASRKKTPQGAGFGGKNPTLG